jgi:DNA-binding transcriptional LysR family regulator
MDLDLRKLRYFVAVAEELNFGRAAERLHIAQPVLSRQIRALEKELHAQLFVRDSSGTQLTPAGTQLLADASLLLAGAEAARRRIAQAARSTPTFTVGFMPGLTVTEPVRALSAAHPDLTVEVLRTTWTNQVPVLHDGRADIGYIRMPVELTGLQTSALFSEPRVAVVPAAHRLAGKEAVSLHDLADEHLLQHPDAVPEWRSVATEIHDSQRATATTQARSVEEKLEGTRFQCASRIDGHLLPTPRRRLGANHGHPAERSAAGMGGNSSRPADRRIRRARPGCGQGCVERMCQH